MPILKADSGEEKRPHSSETSTGVDWTTGDSPWLKSAKNSRRTRTFSWRAKCFWPKTALAETRPVPATTFSRPETSVAMCAERRHKTEASSTVNFSAMTTIFEVCYLRDGLFFFNQFKVLYPTTCRRFVVMATDVDGADRKIISNYIDSLNWALKS